MTERRGHFNYPWERRFCTRCGNEGVIGQDSLCGHCRHTSARTAHPSQAQPRFGNSPPYPAEGRRDWESPGEREIHPDWIQSPPQHFIPQRHFEEIPEHVQFQANRGGRYRQPRGHYSPQERPRASAYQRQETDQQSQYYASQPSEDPWTEFVPAQPQRARRRPRRRNRRPRPSPQLGFFEASPEEFFDDMFDPFFSFGAPNYFGVPYDEEDFLEFPSFAPMTDAVGMMGQRQASTMHFILESMGLDSAFFQPELSFEGLFSQLQAQHPDRIRPASISTVRRIQTKPVDRQMTEQTCAVCQDKFAWGQQTSVLRCEHSFHPDCLGPWLRTNNTCPVCRQTVD